MPIFPLGHVKWFIDYQMDNSNPNPIYDFSITDPAIITWLSIVIILVVLAFFFDRIVKGPPKWFTRYVKKNKAEILHFFQICIGISLLFASHRGAILQPHYVGSEGTQFLEILEATTGILLIANVAVPFASILLLITYLTTFHLFSFAEAIDYINLIGIAGFLFICQNKNRKIKDYIKLGVPILRIFTGLALFILAFSEKLLFPERAHEFLQNYKLNFMPLLGFEGYSDTFFTLSAGAMEAAFGIILMLGLITRINVIVLTGFFLSSNLFFFLQGHYEEGVVELVGHLPVIATVIILFAFGSGELSLTKSSSKQ